MGKTFEGHLNGAGLRIAIVQSRFNALVVDRLVAGAIDALVRHGVDPEAVDIIRVPGTFEIPAVACRLVDAYQHDAVICLGAVVRGETPHFEHICAAAARGIAEASLNEEIPVVFGVLTTDNMDQALDRAGGKAGNKGAEAAVGAIEMANLYKSLPDAALPELGEDPGANGEE